MCTIAVRFQSGEPCSGLYQDHPVLFITCETSASAVKLVPVTDDSLLKGEPAPFDVFDGEGRLLLAAGRVPDTDTLKEAVENQQVFIDERVSLEWKRAVTMRLGDMVRRNLTLGKIAQSRMDQNWRESQFLDTSFAQELSLTEEWESLLRVMVSTLRDPRPDADWLKRIIRAHRRVQDLAARRLDGSMYFLIQESSQPQLNYSALHGLLVCLVCQATARILSWPRDWVQAVGLAALTMNATMSRLQDMLADSDAMPSVEMRQEIERHPLAAQALLQACGVEDPLWTGAVRWHHDWQQDSLPFEQLTDPRKLARLLMRVDIFTARLSRRRSRSPMSPLQAAKRACMGPGGKLDEIGSALLKAVGLYPPGTYVELANGEVGIVVARGVRADLPRVASLRGADGAVMMSPVLRDAVKTPHRVARSVLASEVNVRLNHDKLIGLI